MTTLSLQGKDYEVNELNFLLDFSTWDEDFVVGLAQEMGIDEVTDKHMSIINFVRSKFKQDGISPLLYETCMSNGMSMKQLEALFPMGYTRGVCKLAGIPCYHSSNDKSYRVDVLGFLVDHCEWDRDYALNKAHELQIKNGLTEKHWELINCLRDNFEKNQNVMTVYECCRINNLELEELQHLFPTGYHRGLVKIAGLRI